LPRNLKEGIRPAGGRPATPLSYLGILSTLIASSAGLLHRLCTRAPVLRLGMPLPQFTINTLVLFEECSSTILGERQQVCIVKGRS
jgi:hypothetical protein